MIVDIKYEHTVSIIYRVRLQSNLSAGILFRSTVSSSYERISHAHILLKNTNFV